MPESSRMSWPEEENYFITKFDRSMVMSTYTMAIVISDYDLSESSLSEETGTLVRIAGPEHIISTGLASYANRITGKIIDGFSLLTLTGTTHLTPNQKSEAV